MTKRALSVGINDYPGVDSDLNGCVNDCRDWSDLLTSRGYIVDRLLNGEATKRAMIDAFTRLLDASTEEDTVIFTYSGHGTWIPDINGDEADGRDEALCPYDLSETNLLLDDELADIIGSHRKPKSKLVLIFDCCHSGTMTRTVSLNPGHTKIRYLPPTRFLKSQRMIDAVSLASPSTKSSVIPGTVLLAGCRDQEYSYDAHFGNKPNGAFTYYALQALRHGPATYKAWMQSIRKSLPSAQYPQSPQIQATDAAASWPVLI